ncbi:invasion associated locus B family protein [Pseudooceanicola sp. MF1-13]|uniref:invasion associated locus B family protein n=1 Tax=Pseudooceanicola sp. MF1-13 TaxID=3379095 RepID=UPI0038913E67
MTFFRTFCTSFALLIAGLGTAQAQNASPDRVANGTRFGAWTVSCEALAVNETACVLSQRLVRRADNVFLAELLAFQSASGDREFLIARVPNGVYLPAGFAMKPAEGEAEETRFVWQSCNNDLCEALIELTPEKTESLEAAERLVAGYRPRLGAEPLVFALSLSGLQDGLTALAASTKPAE